MNIHNFFQFKPAVKHLPALAAAVAVTLALAFTPRGVQEGWGTPDEGETWYSTATTNYNCDEQVDENCIYAEQDIESQVLEEGRFELIP